MTWVAVAVGGSAIASGLIGASSAKKAANAQVQSTEQASQVQREMFNKQVELQEPFRLAGLKGQNEFLRLLGLDGDQGSEGYGSLKSGFMPMNWMDQNIDPGYNFRFNEGLKALQHSAAARGGLMSGAFGKALVNYGQEAGSQEYMNAFNRYQTGRNSTLNPLQALFGAGQQASNVLTTEAGNTGRQIGENYMGAGNARASGYIGGANAWAGALGGVGNAALGYQQNQLWNDYLRSVPTGGY